MSEARQCFGERSPCEEVIFDLAHPQIEPLCPLCDIYGCLASATVKYQRPPYRHEWIPLSGDPSMYPRCPQVIYGDGDVSFQP